MKTVILVYNGKGKNLSNYIKSVILAVEQNTKQGA